MPTKVATRIRSPVVPPSRSRSGRGPAGLAGGGGATTALRVVVSTEAVIAFLARRRLLRPEGERSAYRDHGRCKYAYVTVGYATVGCASTLAIFHEDVMLALLRPEGERSAYRDHGRCKYAYVTVGYATVGCASTLAIFHEDVMLALLRP